MVNPRSRTAEKIGNILIDVAPTAHDREPQPNIPPSRQRSHGTYIRNLIQGANPNIDHGRRAVLSKQGRLLEQASTRFDMQELVGNADVGYSYLRSHSDEWYMNRFLGLGGFGVVSLWERIHPAGRVIDRVAMKSEQANGREVNSTHPDISQEAFMHAQANMRGSSFIPQLRDFRYKFTDPGREVSGRSLLAETFFEYRSYLEHCPHKTLQSLTTNYRAWGYHLPESFVWFAFYCLADGLTSLSDVDPIKSLPPFREARNMRFNQPKSDAYMLHNDIKDENTFCADPHPSAFQHLQLGDPFISYPTPKTADFGLAKILREDEDGSHPEAVGGTPEWYAPERRTWMFDDPTKSDSGLEPWLPFPEHFRVKDEREPECFQHSIIPQSDIFSIAMIIYTLMTLEPVEDLSSNIDRAMISARHLQENRFITSAPLLQIQTSLTGDDDYSPALRQLVLDCMQLVPSRRPTGSALMTRIEQGLQVERDRLNTVYGSGYSLDKLYATRVVFDHNVWNSIPQGDCDFGLQMNDWEGGLPRDTTTFWHRFFLDQQWDGPNATKLVPPAAFREWETTQRASVAVPVSSIQEGKEKTILTTQSVDEKVWVYRLKDRTCYPGNLHHNAENYRERTVEYRSQTPHWRDHPLCRGGRTRVSMFMGHLDEHKWNIYRLWEKMEQNDQKIAAGEMTEGERYAMWKKYLWTKHNLVDRIINEDHEALRIALFYQNLDEARGGKKCFVEAETSPVEDTFKVHDDLRAERKRTARSVPEDFRPAPFKLRDTDKHGSGAGSDDEDDEDDEDDGNDGNDDNDDNDDTHSPSESDHVAKPELGGRHDVEVAGVRHQNTRQPDRDGSRFSFDDPKSDALNREYEAADAERAANANDEDDEIPEDFLADDDADGDEGEEIPEYMMQGGLWTHSRGIQGPNSQSATNASRAVSKHTTKAGVVSWGAGSNGQEAQPVIRPTFVFGGSDMAQTDFNFQTTMASANPHSAQEQAVASERTRCRPRARDQPELDPDNVMLSRCLEVERARHRRRSVDRKKKQEDSSTYPRKRLCPRKYALEPQKSKSVQATTKTMAAALAKPQPEIFLDPRTFSEIERAERTKCKGKAAIREKTGKTSHRNSRPSDERKLRNIVQDGRTILRASGERKSNRVQKCDSRPLRISTLAKRLDGLDMEEAGPRRSQRISAASKKQKKDGKPKWSGRLRKAITGFCTCR